MAGASAAPKENPVKAELLADMSAVVPGATFNVAVKFTIEPGWHIYWINPGDAGLPTTVKFSAPAGFKVEPLGYPTPIQFDQPGNVVGYGYTESLVIMAKVTAPADLKPGTAVDLSADAKWLVCKDVCIPGKAAVALQLKVDAKSEKANEALFADWSAKLPAEAGKTAVVTRTVKNEDHTISLKWQVPAKNIEVFTAPGNGWAISNVQIVNNGESAIHFTAKPLNKPAAAVEMPVVVAYDNADGQRRSIQLTEHLGEK